ncbi:glutamate mutase, MutL [Desulforamulus reducens MI-1]|uniref:Glutamate mutase, MutL n=1 Tax=Desulforamulus reducens (strain ATCC BAA-1160 / DSM 100696 / MI-1) TaxID=349161 RepID=A4J7Z4_DESRM|nr:methylaspartate mutase accessory protein GlmL [Desulforamulus reducens]ABO51197.1 glutamate mutase, MutL [Desulforamulus reducens MI-1]
MELALLIDFGSTYTKITAVDVEATEVIATAKGLTTVETNILEGLNKALEEIKPFFGGTLPQFQSRLACSSAAGGLRMVAIGLVKELTVEAARQAALGAGARILGVYAHQLTSSEIEQIDGSCPDIILLAGGTDGGNKETILHNARMLAKTKYGNTIIIAGNKSAADEVQDILLKAGKDVRVTANVLPELNKLNVEPARDAIRATFLEKIVEAKGLRRAETYIQGVLMPTPAAVLNAAKLLSTGTEDEAGLGELIVVDIGGATTDIHSVAEGHPTRSGVTYKGLPEPFTKRTVEGDLGMRVSALSLLESIGSRRLASVTGLPESEVESYVQYVQNRVELLPENGKQWEIDTAMARLATDLAMERHAGTLENVWTPMGAMYIQHGKDLTEVPYLIGTGGVIVNHPHPRQILEGALYKQDQPTVLRPKQPKFLLDKEYILAAVGLLAEVKPTAALRLAKKYMVEA